MAFHLLRAGRLLAGLEVDDVGAALAVGLDAVHLAPDADLVVAGLQGDVEVVLAGDRGASGAVHDVPLQEAFERHARVLLLLRRLPGRVEGEGVPHGVEAFHEDVEVGGGVPGGDLVGEDVDDVAEALGGGGGRVGLHLTAQEPLEGAGVGELVEGAAGEHHGLVAVAQRHLAVRRFVHAPPAVGVRGRHQGAAVLVGERGEPASQPGGRRPRARRRKHGGRPWWRAVRRRERRRTAGGAGVRSRPWARRRAR